MKLFIKNTFSQILLDHLDKTLISLAQQGKKRVLVFCPSFTADCLETFVEIGYEYKKLFINAGGQELQLVESLNDSSPWVEAMVEILQEYGVK